MGLSADNSMVYLKFSNKDDAARLAQEMITRATTEQPLRDPRNYNYDSSIVLDHISFNKGDIELIGTDVFIDGDDAEGKYRDYESENLREIPGLVRSWIVNYQGDLAEIVEYDEQGTGVNSVEDSVNALGPATWENYTKGEARQLLGNTLPELYQLHASYGELDDDEDEESWKDNDLWDLMDKMTEVMVADFEKKSKLPDRLKDAILSSTIAYTHYMEHEYLDEWFEAVYNDYVSKFGPPNSKQPAMEAVLHKNMRRFATKNLNKPRTR
jgi:hypothetical protein